MLYKFQDKVLMSPAKRDKIILIGLVLSVLINVVTWVTLFFVFWQDPEYIVLGYNIYFGISYLGPWYNILLMPLLGALVILFNYVFSFSFYLKEKILSYFLAVTALAFNILMLLSAAVLIYVNI
jgi:hypothetical protein